MRPPRPALLASAALGAAALLLTACAPDAVRSGASSPAATATADGPSPRHVRVIWTEHPDRHAIISWTTMAATARNVVRFDTMSRRDGTRAYSFSVPAARNGEATRRAEDLAIGVPAGWYHHAQLDSLRPSTRYYVAVESDGVLTEERWFLTAPTDDRPFRLLSGGDSRLGGPEPRYAGKAPHVDRQAMNRRMTALFEANPDLLALAHGADWETTADWRHLYWWFEDNDSVRTSDGRLLPMIVSRGNHDEGIGFNEHFWLGDITDANSFGYYYRTQIGPQFALLTLNTEISVAGEQSEWLEEELEALRPTHRWLLAQYHRPAYPAVKDYEALEFKRVRQTWGPLFERFGLDLALESDGHTLKRTVPIRNEQPADDGVVYIGEGGLGVPQRVPDSTRWYLQSPGMSASAHHVWILHVDADSLRAEAIGMDGAVLDRYARAPRPRAVPGGVPR